MSLQTYAFDALSSGGTTSVGLAGASRARAALVGHRRQRSAVRLRDLVG